MASGQGEKRGVFYVLLNHKGDTSCVYLPGALKIRHLFYPYSGNSVRHFPI